MLFRCVRRLLCSMRMLPALEPFPPVLLLTSSLFTLMIHKKLNPNCHVFACQPKLCLIVTVKLFEWHRGYKVSLYQITGDVIKSRQLVRAAARWGRTDVRRHWLTDWLTRALTWLARTPPLRDQSAAASDFHSSFPLTLWVFTVGVITGQD